MKSIFYSLVFWLCLGPAFAGVFVGMPGAVRHQVNDLDDKVEQELARRASAEYSADVQSRLQDMVNTKYAAYTTTHPLPSDAGVLIYMDTPKAAWTASSGMAAGVTGSYRYRAASVSKTFTAAAIMLLDQQGLLKIDDYISSTSPVNGVTYLPATPAYNMPYKNQITIKQLLCHRGGVFDLNNDIIPVSSTAPYAGTNYISYMTYDLSDPNHQFTMDELAGVVASNNVSTAAPNTLYYYSDTGYMFLAAIVERVSGKSFDRYLADNFFTPMALNNTFSPWNANDTSIPAPGFTGYWRWDSSFVAISTDNMSPHTGSGQIISTPVDLAHWIKTLLSGRGPLSRAQVARMTTIPAGNNTYALGIGSVSNLGIGHTGAHPGYVNMAVYNPKDDVSIVVVTPFIDYDSGSFGKITDQLNFITDVAKTARSIAGYTSSWP